jgi:hypothetical protein
LVVIVILLSLISSVVGIGMHRFYRPSEVFGKRWATLIRYGMGELTLFPLRAIFRDAMRRSNADKSLSEEQISAADMMASVSLGVGVLAGHIFDRAEGDDD